MSEDLQPPFSLTYGKGMAHMPLLWHTSMSEFLDLHSPKFSLSTDESWTSFCTARRVLPAAAVYINEINDAKIPTTL